MKTPKMSGDGKHKAEKPQGKIKGSGVNKPVVKAKVAQKKAPVKFGDISQTQKL